MVIKIKKITIKPTSIGSLLLLSMIFLYAISSFLIYTLHLPRTILYLGDVLNIIALFYAIVVSYSKRLLKFNSVFLWCEIFVIISIISSLVNHGPIVLFLWGARNNFRYLIFFFSCSVLLKKRDIDILLKMVKVIFWISVPLCTYQGLFVTYPPGTIIGDMVGGVFYKFPGCNAPLNVILIVQVSVSLIKYFNNKLPIKNLIIVILASVYMSSLAELKVFLIELVLIVLLIMIWNGLSLKTILISGLSIVVLSVFISMLIYFNGAKKNNYDESLTISGLINYATQTQGYDGVGDLNRVTAIPILYDKFMNKDIFRSLFGIGLGNADYSLGFSFLQSDFYKEYNYMNYHYFTAPWMFIEVGGLGVISFLMIFINVYIISNKMIKGKNEDIQLVKIISIFMIFLSFYNTSLRGEQSSYLLYMLLSVPFAIRNTDGLIRRINQ